MNSTCFEQTSSSMNLKKLELELDLPRNSSCRSLLEIIQYLIVNRRINLLLGSRFDQLNPSLYFFTFLIRLIFSHKLEFYLESTFKLEELVDYFYVHTANNMNGTNINVFWYESRPYDHSLDYAVSKKLFLPIEPKDWNTKVMFHENILAFEEIILAPK
jgi:hypothetical protein